MEDPNAVGNEKPSEGELPTVETPAPASESHVSEQKAEPDYKRMYLNAKEAEERANRLEAELREERSRAPSPAAPVEDDLETRIEDARQRSIALAKTGDAAAELSVLLHEKSLRDAAESEKQGKLRHDANQLLAIKDTNRRREVLRHYEQNRHLFGDPDVALRDLERNEKQAEIDRLTGELAKAARKPPEDTVETVGREVSTRELKTREMTRADWEKEQASFEDTDEGNAARRQRQRELRKGSITLK